MTAHGSTEREHINRSSPQDGKGTEQGVLGSERGPANFGIYVAEVSEYDLAVEVDHYEADDNVSLEFTGQFGEFVVEYDAADACELGKEIIETAGCNDE